MDRLADGVEDIATETRGAQQTGAHRTVSVPCIWAACPGTLQRYV